MMGKNQSPKVSTDSLSLAIWFDLSLSPYLHVFTCLQYVLTSGDLYVGHNNLGQPMLVDPTKANNNTPKTAWLFACRRFVLQFKPAKYRLNPAQCRIQWIRIARHLDAITFVTIYINFWTFFSCFQLVYYENYEAL